MQKLYDTQIPFCKRLRYSNRAVIHVNHTKIFLHKNFIMKFFTQKWSICQRLFHVSILLVAIGIDSNSVLQLIIKVKN